MVRILRWVLSEDELEAAETRARDATEAGDEEAAWTAAAPLLKAQARQRAAAEGLLRIVGAGGLSPERSLEILSDIETHHPDDIELVSRIGYALEEASEINFLNRPAPDHPVFARVIDTLSKAAKSPRFAKNEEPILQGLATAARMAGRRFDDVADAAYKRLVDMKPDDPARHYCYGLLLKTRGRFSEGMEANRKAVELAREPVDAYEWNLGICATGAGEGETALRVWKGMDQKIEMGRFGLPEGRYPSCKVRLAQNPLAERGAENDDPGLEETIWIERLSPCHGIIRSVLVQDLGVDYGDVVLIDGAPITHHAYGDSQVPVFPHLATLRRQNYRLFDFAGTQGEARQLMDLSSELPDDAILYSHSEQYWTLCASCWEDPDIDHEEHEAMDTHVVLGRIAAPPDIEPAALLHELDSVVGAAEDCAIYVPSLCEAAGESDRAMIERRRFDLLRDN